MPSFRFQFIHAATALSGLALIAPAQAADAVFFGPTPYLSALDIPAGFYLGGQPTFLDDLEDGSLGGGLSSPGTVSNCPPTANNCQGLSVDADDGAIDGRARGIALVQAGVSSVSVASGPLPTAFGVVITGGNPFATIRFTAFDGNNASLGSVSYSGLILFNGVAGHRFVGVQFADGIKRIEMNAATSVSFDHIQYGAMAAAVPEPETYALMLAGLGLVGFTARRRRV
jgi:hypothetical protein